MKQLILWVIDEQHRAEQQISEASVKKWMPDIETATIMVSNESEGGGDPKLWYAKYITALTNSLQMGFHQILFLDSDTVLLEPVYDIFNILYAYDIVSTHAPARQTTDMPESHGIPDAYCELNTGVFGYRNTSQVRQLFDWWLEYYYAMHGISGDNDQSALRAAMWEQETSVWIMPPEYNFRFGFGGFAGSRVKILHGRSENLPKLIEDVNKEKSMRTFQRGSLR